MKTFLLGLIIGIVLLPVCAFLYVWLGYAPVATAAPPLPLERKLTHMALDARIAKEAPKTSPVPPTAENVMAGAQTYRTDCAVCHGTPSEPQTDIAKGMFPNPPALFKHGVTDDPVGETYWKVKNGIRLTGMPAFGKSLTDEQVWQVAQFLATADKLPPQVQTYISQPLPAK